MRLNFVSILSLCFVILTTNTAFAQDGKIIKVLPHFLDKEGKHTLSPSLYERDAYQFHLRLHPEERSALRYDIQWKSSLPKFDILTLQLELQGSGNEEGTLVIFAKHVSKDGWFDSWDSIQISEEKLEEIGKIISWRATLWSEDVLFAEQKSFLWQREAHTVPIVEETPSEEK